MNVVPEIDVPAHATSFTKVWPELMVQNKVSPLNRNRPLIDHLDVSKKEKIRSKKSLMIIQKVLIQYLMEKQLYILVQMNSYQTTQHIVDSLMI